MCSVKYLFEIEALAQYHMACLLAAFFLPVILGKLAEVISRD